jgi:hypothetical protein
MLMRLLKPRLQRRVYRAMVGKGMIIALRGTEFPIKCDWCGKEITEETAEPEEAGQWVCYECATAPDPDDPRAAG